MVPQATLSERQGRLARPGRADPARRKGSSRFSGGHPSRPPRRIRAVLTVLTPENAARVVLVVLTAVLVWALANILLSPRLPDASYGPAATSRYSVEGVALLIPVLLVASVVVFRVAVPRISSRAARIVLIVGAVGVAFAVQMVIARNTARIPTSDGYLIIGAAYHVAQPDAAPIVSPRDTDGYFSLYSNNIAPSALFAAVFRVAALIGAKGPEDYVFAALLVSNLALLLGAVLTVVAVRRLLGRRAMLFALGPVAVFMVVSPWLNVPYTDTLALPFPIGLLLLSGWVASRVSLRARLVAWAVFGLVAGVGSAVKPTVLFAAIALGAWTLVRSVRRDRSAGWSFVRPLVGGAVGLVLALAGSVAVALFSEVSHVVSFSVFSNPNTLPFTHFLAMGAHGLGGYDLGDVQRDSALPPAERSTYDLQLYFDRVADLGPAGYLLFLGRKLLFVLGDGSFYQGLDGYGPIQAFRTGPFATWIQQWYLLPGAQHTVLATVYQASWIVLLLLAVVPRRGRRAPGEAAVALAILLLLVFQLFSEARSRYFYIDVPFFILLAATGAERLARDVVPAIVGRLRGRATAAGDPPAVQRRSAASG